MDTKDAYIKQLENTILSLQKQVDNLTEMILLLRKEKFGSSSEKTPKSQIDGQLSLFNEAELEVSSECDEPIVRDVKGYTRKATRTTRAELIKDLPVREIPCDIPEEEMFCDQCGSGLKLIGYEKVREELEYIPARLQIIRYNRAACECPKCKHTEHPFIKKAASPSSLMNHSLASPSSVANVMYQKYVNSVPLYRQEKDWENLGLALSRATMAHWMIRCSEDYFQPVTEYLQKSLVSREVLHCDETPVQVLKAPGKKPQSKSYMWLYTTSKDSEHPIVLYDYQPSRSGDNAIRFLNGFHGYLHTDGYSGYNKLENITRCGCWAHLRRKFVEAIPDKRDKNAPRTTAEIGRDYCDQLFHLEDQMKQLTPEDRYTKRLELEKPVLEAFWCWLDSVQALKGSALGKAVTYARNQKPYMENYLLDVRCSLSNNAAENAIRPFTVGRKNWLFADTPKGAKASAAIYSIIETAKANGLNVYTYLEFLLMYMPNTDWRNHPEDLEDLMPWSELSIQTCKG